MYLISFSYARQVHAVSCGICQYKGDFKYEHGVEGYSTFPQNQLLHLCWVCESMRTKCYSNISWFYKLPQLIMIVTIKSTVNLMMAR